MGQTIRDVILKLAIEMKQGNLHAGLEKLGPEVNAAADKAGMLFADRFNKSAAGGIKGFGEMGGAGQFVKGLGSGPMYQPKSSEIRDGLHELERQETLLKRTSGVLGEKTKAMQLNTAAVKDNLTNTLELVRGVGLLGAALGEDTSKWLKYAAAAQGAMDTLGSVKGLVGRLPPQAQLAAGAVGLAASPFLYQHFDEKAVLADSRDNNPQGLPLAGYLNRDMTPYYVGDEFIKDKLQPGQRYFQPRGLMGQAWEGIKGFSDWGLEGLGIHPDQQRLDIGRKQDAENARLAALGGKATASMTEFLRSSQSQFEADRMGSMARADFIGLGGSEKLAMLDANADKFRESLQARLAKVGPHDGAAGSALKSEQGKFELQNARERLTLLQQIGQELEQEQRYYQENLKVSKSQMDLEREKLKSTKERLVSGDPTDVGQLKGLARSLNEGKDLTASQAQLARKYGVGGESADKFFKDQFEKRFTPEERKALAPTLDFDMAERDFRQAATRQQDAMPDLEEQVAQNRADAEKILSLLPQLKTSQDELNAAYLKSMAALKENMDKHKQKVENDKARTPR